MLRLSIALLVAVVLLSTGGRACAAIINTSMVIDANNSFPGQTVEIVDGANPPTVVDIVEGAVVGGAGISPDLIGRGQSRINLLGGGDFGFFNDRYIEMRDISHAVVFSQYEDLGISAFDSALVSLLPGTLVGGVGATGNALLRAEGAMIGSVRTYEQGMARIIDCEDLPDDIGMRVESLDRSTLFIRSTRQRFLYVRDESTVWYSMGGVTDALAVFDRAQFHLLDAYSGDVTEEIAVVDDATLHVYGTDLKYVEYDDGEPPAITGIMRSGNHLYQLSTPAESLMRGATGGLSASAGVGPAIETDTTLADKPPVAPIA